MTPAVEITSGLFYLGTLQLAVIDIILVAILMRFFRKSTFRKLALPIVIFTFVFWSSLWSLVLHFGWTWFYQFVFADWVRATAPFLGLLYIPIGVLFWYLANRVSANPYLIFSLLGGVQGLVSHSWALWGLRLIENVPVMKGVDPIAVLLFACVEKILYWSLIAVCGYFSRSAWMAFINSIRLRVA